MADHNVIVHYLHVPVSVAFNHTHSKPRAVVVKISITVGPQKFESFGDGFAVHNAFSVTYVVSVRLRNEWDVTRHS